MLIGILIIYLSLQTLGQSFEGDPLSVALSRGALLHWKWWHAIFIASSHCFSLPWSRKLSTGRKGKWMDKENTFLSDLSPPICLTTTVLFSFKENESSCQMNSTSPHSKITSTSRTVRYAPEISEGESAFGAGGAPNCLSYCDLRGRLAPFNPLMFLQMQKNGGSKSKWMQCIFAPKNKLSVLAVQSWRRFSFFRPYTTPSRRNLVNS